MKKAQIILFYLIITLSMLSGVKLEPESKTSDSYSEKTTLAKSSPAFFKHATGTAIKNGSTRGVNMQMINHNNSKLNESINEAINKNN